MFQIHQLSSAIITISHASAVAHFMNFLFSKVASAIERAAALLCKNKDAGLKHICFFPLPVKLKLHKAISV